MVARPAVAALGAALALIAAALAYPLWYQFAGPAHYVGPAWPVDNPYFADVLDFVAPSPRQAVAPVLRQLGTTLSASAGVESDAYVGFAVLAVVVFLVWRQRRSERVQLVAGLGVISGLLSMGRYLVVDGRGGKIPLPFDLLAHFPAIDNILPVRFAFTTTTCLAAVIAFGLDDLRTRHPDGSGGPHQPRHATASPVASAFTIVSVVLVVTWLPKWPYASQTVTMLPRAVTNAITGANPLVLTYPYTVAPEDQAYLWQAGARFSFRLLGAYGRMPGSDLRATYLPPLLGPPAVQQFLVGEDGLRAYYPPSPPIKQVVIQTRIFLARHDVNAVLVDLDAPHGTNVAEMFTLALGQSSVTSGRFDLWTVQLSSAKSGQDG